MNDCVSLDVHFFFVSQYIDGHSDLDENQKSVLKASFKHDAVSSNSLLIF